jgi:hypothetical protein
MKIITINELLNGPQNAIYSMILPQPTEEDDISDDVGEIFLKVYHDPNSELAVWTAACPFETSLLNLSGRGPRSMQELVDFLEDKTAMKSIPYDPVFSTESDWDETKRVLVYEDDDIDRMLMLLMDAFPEHAKRVINHLGL